MRKGERTKQLIIEKASGLLNTQGYLATSITDIMEKAGMEKGGIYNHFKSKQELSLDAFSFSIETMSTTYQEAIRSKNASIEKLNAILEVFLLLAEGKPIPGGCPILNAAIESDDAHPALRDATRKAMNDLYDMILRIIRNGIKNGEVNSTIDSETFTTIFISTIEGSLMLTKLYNDTIYINRAIGFLKDYLAKFETRDKN
ncbi:TetR/AcrR family transcriptional repressor of nem operon [Neobacillus sp. B4I6]|jgi:TetR/AcrR family transcriptional regulator, transcriptional repressor for nem operon|uniref:TetR/AcrR family transcriptional regulator n=1 Tax=Priestia megaterium TaxID=1404 RepID=A0A6H1P568_PRIMG|nr:MULTISPECIES: TetR/AcrR family transcriptional regulator [Bacillaceae]MBT2699068.1 TetR/AcrR family transcriptional regulator [Bacillus sp. ISL-40]MBT2722150.1 TetR/AcrR family transcriptional regulator [Bacillus sp. ISL-46]MBT2737964.1 TetR/AcrR family transcriptional regulator [Bacillus sp. ISL-7]PGY09115.1 TetR family transcriptional regulator [Bacillus sp. AFS031507]QIZ08421.1 TetR/AcrR family transcriptional regulator [Priestia megaterium]